MEDTTQHRGADLEIRSSGRVIASPGDPVQLSIRVTNQGALPAASVLVTLSLPEGALLLDSGPDVTYHDGIVSWPRIDVLGPGASESLTLSVMYPAAGEFLSLASVMGLPREANLANNALRVLTEVRPVDAGEGAEGAETPSRVAPEGRATAGPGARVATSDRAGGVVPREIATDDSGISVVTAGRTTAYTIVPDQSGTSPDNELGPLATGSPASGRITVQKEIQSWSGGAPDNPANPQLSGFVFEVRQAGTMNIVATLTTDASGSATSPLPVGSYDVVEVDAQGLTDITGPQGGVLCVGGGDTRLDWVNRQPPLPDPDKGRIRIQKEVQSWSGGVPDNPSPPRLSGFVFEVRQAGTLSVVATLTTDGSGSAISGMLPAGLYDVVEADSEGLVDVTVALDGVEVLAGQTTGVGWINRQHRPGEPDEGRITVQKSIQSWSGGVPDNPTNPQLSGFVFEVRQPGTLNVVATLTTDATGSATSGPLPAGSYNVVEVDAQGLTDVTGPQGGVLCVGGGNTVVEWVNRQAPLPDPDKGRIRIQKEVQSWSGGVPDNPTPPKLSGFRFEVRQAGTLNVVATLTTDGSGSAMSDLLPVASYDIVEFDSEGLVDVTVALDGVVVLGGQTTGVGWINRQPPLPPDPEGRITIRKSVQSWSGGVPDNSANPQLSGFVFEVRQAGTLNVVATLTTEASGAAISGMLPAGLYDVVETDNQGLFDFTVSLDGVVVLAGQTTEVGWINRQHRPVDPNGRITVRKSVQSSTGGTPDNPPNPDLSGFVFEIREAGTLTVVGTLTTDASGSATSDSLPVGSYDIVEVDSQGLVDFTVSLDGVVVLAGQTTEVGWINWQLPPRDPGLITVRKSVQSSTGGAPDSPPNPDLSGFVFEVREAGTLNVVGTLTTDASGSATSDSLPVGSYDIVEIDSQGLVDFTVSLDGVVVLPGQATEVEWINRQTQVDVEIEKTGPATAEPGDPVTYTITATNLGADTARQVAVVDSLPPQVELVSVSGDATQTGRLLRWPLVPVLLPDSSVSYTVTVVPTTIGTFRNVARVTTEPPDDNPPNNRDEVITRVALSPFSDEGLIVGRVFIDCGCEPDVQVEGELGIPGVRVYLQDGTSAVTDSEGEYHFFGLRPRLWVVKVDATTLPTAVRLVPLTNRHAYDGSSTFVDLKRNELAQADFADGSGSPEVASETQRRRLASEMEGFLFARPDQGSGAGTAEDPEVFSHLLPVSGQRPEDLGARPPIPQGSTLPAAPEPRPSLLTAGLLEARLDLRSLADGDLGLARGRDRFEDELRSFQVEDDDGQLTAAARAAFFMKGTVNRDYEFTLRLDTEEDDRSRLFRDIRPDELYPVYGDASIREFDAQSRGRLFGRVQRGASYLSFGDFNTGLGSYGQTGSRALGQYSRTLNGVLEHFENDRVAFNGFASRDRFTQVVDEMPGEGISGPYQLDRTDGLINSEKVELIVRDRDQPAVILQTRSMERFTDYTVEPFSGRVIFNQPVPSVDADLNPVAIRVTYEVEGGGDRFWLYGADGQVRPLDRLEVGGGFVRDENPANPFDLASVNATVSLGRPPRRRDASTGTSSNRIPPPSSPT